MFAQIDYLPLTWAVHRLGGIVTPANAQYSSSDLAHQLKDSGSRCLFTCWPLLQTAIKAAKDAGIARNRIYLLELPDAPPIGAQNLEFGSVTELMMLGKQEPSIDALRWNKGEGKRRAAFISYSSGTSGLPVCTLTQPPTSQDLRLIGNRKESSSRTTTLSRIRCKFARLKIHLANGPVKG